METVLRATERASGNRVELPASSFAEQEKTLQSLFAAGSRAYSEVGIYYLTPKQVVQIKDAPETEAPADDHTEAPRHSRRR